VEAHLPLTSSVEAIAVSGHVAARRQRGQRQARQMGLGGEAASRRQCGGGHIGWGATLWGPAVARRSAVGGWARTGRADRVTGRAAHAGVSLNCIIIDIKRLLGVALRPV
jgi:hypothetical protein